MTQNSRCSTRRHQIALQIERILAETCWSEHFSFHPDDPYYVIGEWEVGDLSEVEAMLKIEDELKLPFSIEDTFALSVNERQDNCSKPYFTFGDLVAIIDAQQASR